MSRQIKSSTAGVYRIRIRGILGEHWSEYLGGMQISNDYLRDPPETVLYGAVVDQSALLGVLMALFDLGFELLSVEHFSPD